MLTFAQLDRLLTEFDATGSPLRSSLSPGLTQGEFRHIEQMTGLRLPAEARVWWGFANGVPRARSSAETVIAPEWWWAPLEDALSLRDGILEEEREDVLDDDERLWQPTWIPFLGTDRIALDVSEQDVAAVLRVSFHDEDAVRAEVGSLGAAVDQWIAALSSGGLTFDAAQRTMVLDEAALQRLDTARGLL